MFLEISQNLQENTCVRASFLIKLQARPEACNFIKKETLTQVFPFKFCEISKNTFFYRTPLVVASENDNITITNTTSMDLTRAAKEEQHQNVSV